MKTYSVQAIEYIKRCLLDGSLAPGSLLRETELAQNLGISRGPVREALLALQEEGLVTGEPQKAKSIRHLTIREIEDSYQLGGALEGACIVLFLENWDAAALTATADILAEMERQCRRAQGLAILGDIDDAFHNSLLAPCRNRLMARIARKSCQHISKFLYYKAWDQLFSPQEFYQRHVKIFDAVSSRDSASIQFALLDHYAESGRRLGKICGKQEVME